MREANKRESEHEEQAEWCFGSTQGPGGGGHSSFKYSGVGLCMTATDRHRRERGEIEEGCWEVERKRPAEGTGGEKEGRERRNRKRGRNE